MLFLANKFKKLMHFAVSKDMVLSVSVTRLAFEFTSTSPADVNMDHDLNIQWTSDFFFTCHLLGIGLPAFLERTDFFSEKTGDLFSSY